MALGQSWARPLEQTWYVRAETRRGEIEARLAGLLDGDDGLLIQAVSDERAADQHRLRWFRQRRAVRSSDDTNVIAFPVPGVVAAQAELPLAQAG